ncbi:MAG: peptidylprolyl isomerase [Burkholderiales bacterium]|nr:peptidylprolyl isomerase [Burkholderiales bacterium]
MMRNACFASLFLATVTSSPVLAEPVTLDRVVAIVNKTAITEIELEQRVDNIKRNLERQHVAAPTNDVLRHQVLERLVLERVLVDYGAEIGMKVDDTQIDHTMERIAQQNKMTVPQFKVALEKEGTQFNEFREEVRQDMLTQRLREREVDNKVFVTDSEVDQYLAQNKTDGQGAGREFHLAHILIALPEGAAPDLVATKARRAEGAARALAGGQPFAEVAASFSEAQDALSGGDIGWRSAGRLPPTFLDAIQKLKDGEVTSVIRSPAGFHILKLVEHRDRDAKEIIKQTHVRHILVKVNELTSESDAKARIVEIRDRINAGAKFEEQAKLYSEDGTASKGGDLDWINPGDTVPEFEQAMNALPPGELSQPVRTSYGWHLIQVIERKEQDVTKDKERLRVRTELRDRKADEQYDEWIRQQRDRAFVEMRLDEK